MNSIMTGRSSNRFKQGIVFMNNSRPLYCLPDAEEGYSGNLDITVIYILTDKDELKIEHLAITDKATPVTLINHSYSNLSGHPDSNILDHQLMINTDQYIPMEGIYNQIWTTDLFWQLSGWEPAGTGWNKVREACRTVSGTQHFLNSPNEPAFSSTILRSRRISSPHSLSVYNPLIFNISLSI